jgi:hypothetical protein|uniref:Receptor Binding Protein sandwich domain, phage receptor n=1 Tax=Myoviridae sp. ctXVO17 TaxID=2825121 RepID=A0A8S5P222_9CAUD|nr:MAG TPA: Receptor Binding Protein sandwich domain, phage receptor [Myoviridae sp. ctXVO17]
MAHLVTGYAGKEHIRSADQGSFNAAFFGDGEFVMSSGSRFAGAIINNNTVRISDGDMLMQGRHIRIEPNTYEDLTISTGTAGTNRIDLIVMTYEKNAASGIESAKLEVVQGTATSGTPSAPEIVSGDILNGDLKNQMPLYAVYVSGVALTKISTQFMVCPTYKDLAIYYAQQFQNACETHLNSLNIIDSADAIDANSAANQLAGALGVKELASQKAPVAHIHDDLYYRKAILDQALSAKSDTNHNHDERYSRVNHNHDERYCLPVGTAVLNSNLFSAPFKYGKWKCAGYVNIELYDANGEIRIIAPYVWTRES